MIDEQQGLPVFNKVARLFRIKTRTEVFLVTYALGVGAVQRGFVYVEQYPGIGGKLLFLACTGAVFMAGAKMLEAVELRRLFVGED